MEQNLWPIIWSAVLASILYGFYCFVSVVLDVRKRGQAVDKFPSDPKHWLWGHIHLFPGPNEAGLQFLRLRCERFPMAHALWRGFFMPALTTLHPSTSKIILHSAEPKPMGLGVYGYGRPWLGDGLLVSGGAKWARNRRLLTPAFHFDILKPYIKVKNEATNLFLNKLSKYAKDGRSFEFYSNVSLLTFDIILRCACSYENDVQIKGENHPYVQAINRLCDLWVKRTLQPWFHYNFVYNLTKNGREFRRHCDFVHSVSTEVIRNRKETLAKKNEQTSRKDRYLDFLDVLLMAKDEDGKGLADQEIRDEVDTFLFEGHDTTASSISWTLYSLAEHPEIQRKCQAEIDSVLDDDNHTDDTIEWEDLAKLQYLTLCIKESMRLHCPVPFVQRQIENEMVIDGVTLPKGSVIDVNIYNLHHNQTVWEEPMEYRPERFLPENLEKKDTYAFIPFSAGPRNCIGQHFAMHEQKVVLARILRKFTIEHDPDFKVEKKMSLVMKTEKGMYMKAVLRT